MRSKATSQSATSCYLFSAGSPQRELRHCYSSQKKKKQFYLNMIKKVMKNSWDSPKRVLINSRKFLKKFWEGAGKVPGKLEKLLREFWKSSEKVLRKSWKSPKKILRKYWESTKKVLRKSWESCERVLRKSLESFLNWNWEVRWNLEISAYKQTPNQQPAIQISFVGLWG